RVVGVLIRARHPLFAAYLVVCGIAIWSGRTLPQELFPTANPDQFQLRMRAPDGTRLEATEELALGVLDTVKQEAGPDATESTLANIGNTPPSYPVNAIFVWNSGPQEAVLLVSMKRDPRRSLPAFEDRLRRKLAARFPDVAFSFEAGDVISQVLNTGSPNPVNV